MEKNEKISNGVKLKCCTSDKDLKAVSQTADLLKIIADQNRLKILCILKNGEQCVCDIWQNLGILQNLASHHLKVLKKAGLIDSHREGLKVIYRINQKSMRKFNSLLNNFLQTYEK
jgi:ArsR family transcriptional regulator